MKLLITGICGFVGSTLALALRESQPDWEIGGIDSLIRRGSQLNVERLRARGIEVRHGDLRNRGDLQALPAADWIIDCAANPSVLAGIDGKSSSRQLVEHNLIGTIELLELAKQWNAGFIMLSTSRVYSIAALAGLPMLATGARADTFILDPAGNLPPGVSPAGVGETFSTSAPLSLYGSSKLASEALALEYGSAFGFPVYVNRCGVLAGAGQFGKIDQGIFSYWLHAYAARRKLKYIGFEGTGRQVRDCLHAADLAPLLVKQIAAGQRKNRLCNVSGGVAQSLSLAQLTAWCEQRFGKHEIEHSPTPRPFDIPWLILDSARAQAEWDWQPQISMEKILNEIAEHASGHPEWLALCED